MSVDKPMGITLKQQKIISNPLRSKIISVLMKEPMTAKQTATYLKMDPGTIYYHIKLLHSNDILTLEYTDTSKGIVEKYYKSKATFFSRLRQPDEDHLVKSQTSIFLTENLIKKMQNYAHELFKEFDELSKEEKDELKPCLVEFSIKEIKEVIKDEEEME